MYSAGEVLFSRRTTVNILPSTTLAAQPQAQLPYISNLHSFNRDQLQFVRYEHKVEKRRIIY
jgi:hypothetical protein